MEAHHPAPAPPAAPPKASGDRRAALLLLAVLLLGYWPALFGNLLSQRDLPRWAWPGRELLRQALRSGRLPQWDPYVGLGVPTLGAPVHGTFYPGHLLLFIFPTAWSLPVTWLLHAFVGGLGGYLLLRRLGCRPAAAFLSGLFWLIGGYAVSMWGDGEKVLSGAFIPWAALFLLALCQERRLVGRKLVPAAAALALMALAGDPFLWFHAVGLGATVAFGALAELRPLAALSRVAFRTFAALVLATLLAAPALVPAAGLISGTERAGGLPRDQAESWSLHPVRLLELVSPGALGDPLNQGDRDAYPGAHYVAEPDLSSTPWAISIYSGAALLLFAPLALRRRRLPLCLLALAAFGLLLALGRHTPVNQFLRQLLPPLRYLRYPEKHILFTLSALSILSALGLSRLLAGEVPLRRPALCFFPLALFALCLCPADLRPSFLSGLVHAGSVALLLLVAVGLSRRQSRYVFLVPLVASFDLWLCALPLLHWTDTFALRTPPPLFAALLAHVKQGAPPPRLYRPRTGDTSLDSLPDNLGLLYGIGYVPGHDPLLPAQLHTLWDRVGKRGQTALRLFDIGWVLYPGPAPRGLSPVASLREWTLFSVPGPGPGPVSGRVSLATEVEVKDDEQALTRLSSAGFDPSRQAVVAPGTQARPLASPGGGGGACAIDRYQPEEVQVSCHGGGLLVLFDAFWRGWSATVDGVPAPIQRANLIMRGVYLSPGNHVVLFRFHTPGLFTGLALCLLGLVAAALLLFRGPRPAAAKDAAKGA